MEQKLDNILDNMMQNDNTVGALLSDNQGLCYGSELEGKSVEICGICVEIVLSLHSERKGV
jgi:hypothetical protein